MLKKFHAFCEENGIRYFLAYGTLLGAIRYKRFIPWDDDGDVLVPREDYEKLMAKVHPKPSFKTQTPAKSRAKISRFIAVLARIGFIADPTDCLRMFQVLT